LAEALERRVLLAGTPAWVLGAPPTWKDEGPTWETDAQVQGMGYRHDPVSGAVNAIAPDPVDPTKLYIASVDGGLWMTTAAITESQSHQNTIPEPDWIP